MCDPHTLNKIEALVEAKMVAGEMFTAFDITLALQHQGVKKRHRQIRKDIRQTADTLMWRFGYQNSYIDLPGIGAKAHLYHPFGSDTSSFRPSLRAAQSGKTAAQSVQRFPDKRNTVSIPSRFARALGFAPGDKVTVSVDAQSQLLKVTKPQGRATDGAKAYTVDKYCNVRVTRAAFKLANITANAYLLTVDVASIAIKPV